MRPSACERAFLPSSDRMHQVDTVVLVLILSCASLLAWRRPRLRGGVALTLAISAIYIAFKTVASLISGDTRGEAWWLTWWPLALSIAMIAAAAMQITAIVASRAAKRARGAGSYGELSDPMLIT